MEPATGSSANRDATRLHLDAARAALRALDQLATPDGATLAGRMVASHLDLAMNELTEADRQIALGQEAAHDVPRVPCSFCGKMIMPRATLCGFCWRRRNDPASAGSTSPPPARSTEGAAR